MLHMDNPGGTEHELTLETAGIVGDPVREALLCGKAALDQTLWIRSS